MKNLLVIFCLLVTVRGMAQNKKFVIDGQVGQFNSSGRVMMDYEYSPQLPKKLVKLRRGKFNISGYIKEPTLVRITLLPKGMTAQSKEDEIWLFLIPGKTHLVSKDSLMYANVTGTRQNEQLQAYFQQIDALYRQVASFKGEKDSVQRIARRQLLEQTFKQYAAKNPRSLSSLLAITQYSNINAKEARMSFQQLAPEIRNNKMGKSIGKKLDRMLLATVGTIAPDFRLCDPHGQMFKLSSYRGKYVLIDFWASWCIPCRLENVNMIKVYEEFKGNNFDILGVSLERPGEKDKWLDAIAHDHLSWTNVSDLKYNTGPVTLLYGVEVVPQNFLIDPRGVIIAKSIHGEQLKKKLQELVGLN